MKSLCVGTYLNAVESNFIISGLGWNLHSFLLFVVAVLILLKVVDLIRGGWILCLWIWCSLPLRICLWALNLLLDWLARLYFLGCLFFAYGCRFFRNCILSLFLSCPMVWIWSFIGSRGQYSVFPVISWAASCGQPPLPLHEGPPFSFSIAQSIKFSQAFTEDWLFVN